VDSRVVSRAVVIATGVTADGGREVLGLDVGDSEDGAFWTAFLHGFERYVAWFSGESLANEFAAEMAYGVCAGGPART
jgi:hypothetical protein